MSRLLEDAIIDAKAVRATALANAKAALVEAFLPQAQEMLSQKLKEEAGMDDFQTDVPPTDTNEPVVAETVGDIEKAGAKLTGPNHPKLKSAKAQDKMKKQETEKWLEEGGEIDATSTEIPPAPEDPMSAPGEENVSDVELEEILAELGADMEEEGEVPAPQQAPAPEMPVAAAPAPAPEMPVAPAPAPAPEMPVAPAPASPAPVSEEDMEEVNLEELLQSLNEEEDEEEEEEEDEEEKEDDKECYEAVLKERNDAVAAVNHYKSQLNELNLLNAKLLYTNKLFKNYSMTNAQKMKIVETFDLTQTVREVKIAYTSLAESFNFGKSTVKKSNTAVKTITEGLASKTVTSTKPAPSMIVENTNAQAQRFQTLAGIKKA